MKSSPPLRTLLALALLIGAAPLGAQDYQCRDASGCVATIYQDGAPRRVLFRKGDLVSTAAGWVVDPKDGWVRIPRPDEDGRALSTTGG